MVNKSLCCIVNPAQCLNDDIDSEENYIRCPNTLDQCDNHLDGYHDSMSRTYQAYWCERCILDESIRVERRHDLAKDRKAYGM